MKIDENKFIFDKFSIGDLFYADYCDRRTMYEQMVKMKSYVKGKVLDFGCGKKPYQKIFQCDEYIGIDTESSGHGWQDKEGPDIFYDGNTIPFEPETFDTVISTQVFEHVSDIDFSMLEITRVLKSGGYLIVSVPMAEEEHERPYDFRRFTEIGVRDYVEKYGYEIIEAGKLNSWKNSMRILNIGRLCHDTHNSVVDKVKKYGYIVYSNFCRIIFGNRVKNDLLFSNKVYCVAKKE